MPDLIAVITALGGLGAGAVAIAEYRRRRPQARLTHGREQADLIAKLETQLAGGSDAQAEALFGAVAGRLYPRSVVQFTVARAPGLGDWPRVAWLVLTRLVIDNNAVSLRIPDVERRLTQLRQLSLALLILAAVAGAASIFAPLSIQWRLGFLLLYPAFLAGFASVERAVDAWMDAALLVGHVPSFSAVGRMLRARLQRWPVRITALPQPGQPDLAPGHVQRLGVATVD